MPPQPNVRFGKYELLSRLARGGMAETYRGQLKGAAGVVKPVVIKKVLPHMAQDEGFVQGFIQEARLSAQLSHGNIAQVFDFGRVGDEYFLAMEYVPGRTLRQMLDRASDKGFWHLPLPIACFVVAEMLKGLHYAHTRIGADGKPLGLVHRDVSPENVLVSYEGEVKVIDFGVAKAKMSGRQETEPGLVKGKYRYFSPEQAAAKALDARSDVYASGVVLYRTLAGRTPYEGQLHVVLRQLLKGEYPPLEELNPDVPHALATLCARALKTKREERFRSAGEFGEELSQFLHKLVPGFSAREVGEWMRWLFPEEAEHEGLTAAPSKRFLEQIELWRPNPPPVPPDGVSGEMRKGTEQATAQERTPSAVAPAQAQEKKLWPVALGVVAVAVLVGVVAVILTAGNNEASPVERAADRVRNLPKPVPLPDENTVVTDDDAAAPDAAVKKAKPAEERPVFHDEAAISDVLLKLAPDRHRVRFVDASAPVTFELEAGKTYTLRLKGKNGDSLFYALLGKDNLATSAGLLSYGSTFKGPSRVRLFDVPPSGATRDDELAFEMDGQPLRVATAALTQGVSRSLAFLRGLKPDATYRVKMRTAPGNKAVVLVVWEDTSSYLIQRHLMVPGDTLEVKGTTDVGFGFVQGVGDGAEAQVLFGQTSGAIDVSTARAACDRLPKLQGDAEAAQFAQATCALLPKALALQAERETKEREDAASEDVVAKAQDKLSDGHYAEAVRLLEECAKKNARSCACPMMWRQATQARGVRPQGFMARRIDVCLPPEAHTGALPPELRRQGIGLDTSGHQQGFQKPPPTP